MSDSTILATLRRMAFFEDIPSEHLEQLTEISRPVEYPAHANIFREGDIAGDVYVVVSGRVSLVICEPKVGCRQLMEVSDGELIGWSPLVGRHRLSDTARTLTPTKVLAIDGEQLVELCRKDPRFGFLLMHRAASVLAQRLTATRLQLLEMSGFHLPDVQIESD